MFVVVIEKGRADQAKLDCVGSYILYHLVAGHQLIGSACINTFTVELFKEIFKPTTT